MMKKISQSTGYATRTLSMATTNKNIARHVRNGVIVSVLVALITVLAVRSFTALRVSAEWLSDVQVVMLPPPAEQHPDIVVLALTEDTLATLPFRAPISRQFLAKLLSTIEQKGVRAVGVDILFDQPTNPSEDEALKRTLENYSKPIVVAVGNEQSKLTPRQREFQAEYLSQTMTGVANLVKHDGTVRYTTIAAPAEDGGQLGFAAAVAREIGVTPPAEPERLVVRVTLADKPFFRVFPAERAGLLPRAWLEDKVVLIGGILPQQDRHRTPLSALGGDRRLMAGVLVHAHMLAQFMDGTGIPILPIALEWLLLAMCAALGFLIVTRSGTLYAKVIIAVLSLVALWASAITMQRLGGPVLPLFASTLSFLLSLAVSWVYFGREERAARRFLRDAFTHYLSPNVIDDLVNHPEHMHLGGERRVMSFVFADIADFTSLSESMEPEALVSLLQSYQDGMVDIALGHGATIERFVGDATMIFFGAPVEQADHAERAVRCARDWDDFSQSFREQQRAKGIEMGVTRIGAHTGPAVVGNIGGKRRFAYTAHGDTVNVAARLETANKQFGTRVCMSKEIAEHCPEVRVRPIGNVVLKGKTEPVQVVTLPDDLSELDQIEYVNAFNALLEHRSGAREQIYALARKHPDDALLGFHQAHLMRGGNTAEIRLEEK
jgi:class 3 adenylate cyclase